MSLNYSYPQIVLAEVPGEISLALSVSGCPLRCKGCHSTFTYDSSYGAPLTPQAIGSHLNKHVTCVLFYGGEWQPTELLSLLKHCKDLNLKTCLYTGHELSFIPKQLLQILDFIKVGKYTQALGGLESPTTNQRFYELLDCEIKKEHVFYPITRNTHE